jgi:UDP-glucose:(heptosyl)LPS alpha-1,3-glucosyltransferase
MNIKVAYIVERADVSLGGAERSVFEMAEAVSSLGYQADIIAANGQAEVQNLHILCKDKPGKRTDFTTFEQRLKEYFRKNHYDIIHSVLPFDFADVYQPRGGSYPEAAIRNAASYQNIFIEWYKNKTACANLRRTRLAQAEKKLCEKADGPIVAALSNYVAEQFKRHYNLNNKRLIVIPNGVKIKTKICERQAAKLQSLLADKFVDSGKSKIIFLFAANNFRLKGLQPLFKAIKTIGKCRCLLLIVGNGEIRKFHNLARKFKIEDKTIFAGGISNIQSALSLCDVAVLPTFYDPASRFILEALAANKPVITTKFNGATDLFTADRHGKIINSPENISELAQAIGYFTDADNIRKTSQAIIEDNILQNISIERVARQLDSLYKTIPERKK